MSAVFDRFKAQLAELAGYIENAELRGEGVQVVLSANAGEQPGVPKLTIYGAPLTSAHRKRNM